MNATPTVLDFLRENLLGDELADRLEQWLTATFNALEKAPAEFIAAPVVPEEQDDVEWDSHPVVKAMYTPSPGYEPLLMKGGWCQFSARGAAKIAVRYGRRRAAEGPWERPVTDAIRFLAKQPRQHRSIVKRAKLLLEAYQNTSLIETLFYEAQSQETEFICLLKATIEGRRGNSQRLTDIAAGVAPFITLKRGPKVTAESAAHEFLFGQELGLSRKRGPYLGRTRRAEYMDPKAEATRREFGLSNFDPRPARRRLKSRRTKADQWD